MEVNFIEFVILLMGQHEYDQSLLVTVVATVVGPVHLLIEAEWV